jgi:hypothetical protein
VVVWCVSRTHSGCLHGMVRRGRADPWLCFVIYGPDGPSTRHGGSSVTESTWVTASSASSATAEAVSHGCAQARVYDARIEFRVTLEPKPGTGIRITRTHSLGNPYAAPVNPFSAATSTSGTGGPCSSALPLPTVTTVCIPVVPSHILAMGLDFVMLYGLIQTLEMYLRHEIPHRLCQGLHQEHVILLVGRLHAYNIVTRYLDKWYIEDKLFSQVKVGATVLRSVHMLLEMLPQRNMVQIRYGV